MTSETSTPRRRRCAAWTGSSLILGGVLALVLPIRERLLGDMLVARTGSEGRKKIRGTAAARPALTIVLGIILDGIPESAVIGLRPLEGNGASVTVIAAVLLSNLPEAIAATTGLASGGWTRGRILGLWMVVTVVSGLASLLPYAETRRGPKRSRLCSRSRVAQF